MNARRISPLLLVWYVFMLAGRLVSANMLAQARRQSQPRRWPWQPKTLRDHADAYRAELTALLSEQGAALLAEVQRQSRRRRWPWQAKTIRDLLDERGADVAALAAERSATLAAAVAARTEALRAAAEQQSQPRRWPWQPKTLRDRVSDQSADLAARASARSAELAQLARAQRDALLDDVRRQSRPRRWPWQAKTLRDRVGERGQKIMADQLAPAADRLADFTSTSAQAVAQTGGALGGRVQQLVAAAPGALDAATSTAASVFKDAAHSTRASVSAKAEEAASTLKDVAHTVGSTVSSRTDTAASALQDAAQNLRSTVSATAENAAAAAQRPATAVSGGVRAGRRRVRRGVRLVRTALWAGLIGAVVGLLFAKTSGAELRRQLRALAGEVLGGTAWQAGDPTIR